MRISLFDLNNIKEYVIQTNINQNNKYDTVNFYIDIDNMIPNLYEQVYYNSIQTYIDLITRNMESIINTIIQINNMFTDKFKVNIFIVSAYNVEHKSICQEYKKNRKQLIKNIDYEIIKALNSILKEDIPDSEITKATRKFLYNNLSYAINNYIDNTLWIHYSKIEADYILAYLLLNYELKDNNKFHVILSSDKDFMQLLFTDNIIQYRKTISKVKYDNLFIETKKENNIIDKNNLSKFNDYGLDFYYDIPLLLAIDGDQTDNVRPLFKDIIKPFYTYKLNKKFTKKDFYNEIIKSNQDRYNAGSFDQYTRIVLDEDLLQNEILQCNFSIVSFEKAIDKSFGFSDTTNIERIVSSYLKRDSYNINIEDIKAYIYSKTGLLINI